LKREPRGTASKPALARQAKAAAALHDVPMESLVPAGASV